ncbi:MAG TPA: MFS transporter, partial [Candidatus Wallbacteria bacterium]|nr:MFS transporter [Candidatus Wallbacteria bacterium]
MSRARILIIVLATGLTSFLSSFLSSSVNLALKSIAAEYAVNPADLSLVTSVFLLFSSLFIVPFGNLSDAYGPKRTLVFGCAFFTASNFLVPLVVNSFSSLVAMRGLSSVACQSHSESFRLSCSLRYHDCRKKSMIVGRQEGS